MSTDSKIDSRREGVIPPPVPTPCGECAGHCCTSGFGWTGIELKSDETNLFPRNDVSQSKEIRSGLSFTYQFPKSSNASCVHFKNGKCKIYDKRPKACRDFDCVEYYVNDARRLFKHMSHNVGLFMRDLLKSHVGDV